MSQIVNKTYFNYFLYLFFIALAYFIVKTYGYTMLDDGWRHLGMAIYKEEVVSWQRVFPHSLYTDFDPWFTWHKLLAFIGNFVEKDNIPIIVNTFMYSAISFWYYIIFKKFSKLKLIYILILSSFLPLFHIRYFFLRPDLLSGLFILYLIIVKNRYLIFIISLIYAPFYYIFWFYLGFMGYVKLILRDYKTTFLLFVVGIFTFSFYFIYDFEGYIQVMNNVLNNDTLLQGRTVTESNPFIIPIEVKNSLGTNPILLFLMLFSLLVYYGLKPKNELLIYFLLLTPLCLIQYRFLNLLQPLIFSYLIILFHQLYKYIETNGIVILLDEIQQFLKEKTYFGNINRAVFKIFITICILIYFIVSHNNNLILYDTINKVYKDNHFLKDKQFHNKRILISNMGRTMYMGVFLNPSAQYMPGCSLGWVDYNKENKEIYFKLLRNNKTLTNKELFKFIEINKVDYFILDTMYNTNFTLTKEVLEKNNLVLEKIISTKLIFKRLKATLSKK